MTTHRKTTLWAAMLSAWLAAGQTAAPPPPAADAPEAPHQADEGTAPAPEPPQG